MMTTEMSTIRVSSTTLDRFNRDKVSFSAEQGLQMDADQFINALLEAYEISTKIPKSELDKMSTSLENGGNE